MNDKFDEFDTSAVKRSKLQSILEFMGSDYFLVPLSVVIVVSICISVLSGLFWMNYCQSEEYYINNDVLRNKKILECRSEPIELSSRNDGCSNAISASKTRAKQIDDTKRDLENAPIVGKEN